MCRALAPRALELDVDDEVVTIRFDHRGIIEFVSPAPAAVSLRTSRAAILAMIDGQHSLVSAVLAGILDLRGRPADVSAFHDGFTRYLEGGVRARSFPRLLEEFREVAAHGGAR